MLTRALLVYLSATALLTSLSVGVQDVPFEAEHLLWGALFALPLGLSVLLGSLGTTQFAYPNASFGIVAIWISAMAPSYIVDHPESHQVFMYTEQGVTIGRWLFFVWCVLFVMAAGKAHERRSQLAPRMLDAVAVTLPVALALGYQVIGGSFSNYRAGNNPDLIPHGSAAQVALGIGNCVLTALPGFFLLVGRRASSGALVWFTRIGFVTALLVMFLNGGRSALAYTAVIWFFVARVSGVTFRPTLIAGAALGLPLAFFFMFTYRTALAESSSEFSSLSDFTTIATDSTSAVVQQAGVRNRAVLSFSDNVRVRVWFGPQFFTVVDEWLDHGPAYRGTPLDNVIRLLPTVLFPEKNAIADEYKFESAVLRTGRFPQMDLSPTPWMQWLYETGPLGLIVAALCYGWLVRFLDRRAATTHSTYVFLFVCGVLSLACSPEVLTDVLLVSSREVFIVACLGYVFAFLVRRLMPQPRPALATTSKVR